MSRPNCRSSGSSLVSISTKTTPQKHTGKEHEASRVYHPNMLTGFLIGFFWLFLFTVAMCAMCGLQVSFQSLLGFHFSRFFSDVKIFRPVSCPAHAFHMRARSISEPKPTSRTVVNSSGVALSLTRGVPWSSLEVYLRTVFEMQSESHLRAALRKSCTVETPSYQLEPQTPLRFEEGASPTRSSKGGLLAFRIWGVWCEKARKWGDSDLCAEKRGGAVGKLALRFWGCNTGRKEMRSRKCCGKCGKCRAR